MKVRKVKLRGFLTYKDEVEIDFTRLFDKKIFLISGPTGSGKTTIFDAISFALYGEVPREIAKEDLRSDYLSENDDFSYVDLEFSLGEKIYKIRRVPTQRAVEIKSPKNISHSVEFYDITDGKVLITDKVNDPEKHIEKIVGLDKDQFTKVMLLAQGQFQKFLTSKSSDKTKLLSDIFKTDAQRAIQDELKSRAQDNKAMLGQVDKDLENVISYNEILSEKISEDAILSRDFENIFQTIEKTEKSAESFLNDLLKSLSRLEKKEKTLIKDLEKAKALNDNIEKYKKADFNYQNLLKDFEKNTKTKADLDLIAYALSIKIYEDRLEKTKADLKEFIKEKALAEKKLGEKRKELKELEKDLERLPEKKSKLDQAKILYSQKIKEIADFDDFIEVKKSYEAIKDLDKDLKRLENEIKAAEKDLDRLRDNFNKNQDDLAKAKEEGFAYREKISKITSKLESLGKDYVKLKENKTFEENIGTLAKDLEKTKVLKAKADLERDYVEINKLIDRLNREGVCPVCGKSHEGERDKLPVRDFDIEKITEKIADLQINLEKNKAIYQTNLRTLDSSYKLGEIGQIIKENKELLESYTDLKNKNKEKTDKLTKSLEKLTQKGKKLKEESLAKKKSYDEIKAKLADLEELKIKYLAGEKAMAGIDRSSLLKEKQAVADEISDLDLFIKSKEKNKQDLILAINDEKSIIESRQASIKKAEAELKTYEKDFKDKVKEKFEDINSYKSYLSRKVALEENKDFIEEYFKKLEREKTTRENFLAYKDESPVDIEKYEEDLDKLATEIKNLDDGKIAASSRLDLVRKDGDKIKKIHKAYQNLEKTAQIVNYLSELANGETGAVEGIEKLDFETFILSVYFDRVLNFANIRFNQMTDGQFSMVRKTEAADKRSKMGLDIEILDSNTGKKRPASTLSGGENFLASLSLALGLSDEIGAENGGIRIDTLFIDEGFGTLSKDFLSNAINTIEKLSKEDRFVGLISHVDELKDAIEAKILISYDPSKGSSLEIVND